MRFNYKAFDKSGRAVAAAVDAPGRTEAVEMLRRDGLFVTELMQAVEAIASPDTPAEDSAGRWPGRMRAGQRLRNLAMFARQLQVLVSSGTPLVQSLSALERQAASPVWQSVLARLRAQVEEGVPMSQAMAQQPQIFDQVCRSLTAAGETSGSMGEMLGRLATLLRRQLHLRTAVVGALIYPCVLVVIGVIVVVLMLLFVLPRFVELFTSLDVPLPPTTQILVSMSQALQHYWWAVLLACASAGAGARVWWVSGSGRKTLQRALLQAPKLGMLVKGLITARLTRLLGVLVESQVPLLEALKLTRAAAVNYRYADLIALAEEAVARGEPVSTALADPELITPAVYEAVRSGEQSGKVGSLLLTMADFLDEENEAAIKSLTSLLEPLILVVLGILVAFIALSMFLPLFDLAAIAQGGK
jgi:type II secretory pathway component PulF